MKNGSGNKKKAKRVFSREEAVTYLRQLADQLESGAIQVSEEEMEFEGQVKVKESLKSKKGKTSVKVELKLSTMEMPPVDTEEADKTESAPEPGLEITDEAQDQTEAEDETAEKPLSFKKLKKLMNARFKQMGKDLDEGKEIATEDIQAFFDSCIQMVSFKDQEKGEAFSPEFEAKARDMVKAAKNGSLDELNQAYQAMKDMKKACHKKYK